MESTQVLKEETKISRKLNVLLQVYRSLSAPVKASFWFAICNFLQQGISMLTVPVFTRLLTTGQYGVYTVYQSWYSIISIFATLNLSAGVFNNGMVKYEEDKAGYISALQGLSTTVTIGLFFVYLIFREFWNRCFGLSTLFVITMFVQALFIPAYLFWSTRQRFEYQYRSLIGVTLVIAVGSPVAGILAVLSTDYKAEARIISYVLIQAVVGLIFYVINFNQGRLFYFKYYWKYALTFNIPLLPHYLSMTVLGQVGRIMINNMVGGEQAAIYSVAFNVSLLISLVTQAINSSFIPYTYQALKDKHYRSIGENADRLLILVGGVAIFAMAFGPEVIRIFAPAQYYEAAWIIPPAVTGAYFAYLYPLFGNVEFYFEENIYIMLASILGAAINVLLNLALIPVFGYMVAGYTTLVCYILFGLSHYLFYKKVVRKHIPGIHIYDMKHIAGISCVVLATMSVMLVIYRYPLVRYGIMLGLTTLAVIKRHLIISQLENIRHK